MTNLTTSPESRAEAAGDPHRSVREQGNVLFLSTAFRDRARHTGSLQSDPSDSRTASSRQREAIDAERDAAGFRFSPPPQERERPRREEPSVPEILKDVREALDTFVRAELREPSDIGFLAPGGAAIDTKGLRAFLEEKFIRLELALDTEADALETEERHQLCQAASDLLEETLNFLRSEFPGDAVPQNSQGLLFAKLLELKTQFTALIQEDAIASFRAAAAEELEDARLRAEGDESDSVVLEPRSGGALAAGLSAMQRVSQGDVPPLEELAKGIAGRLKETMRELRQYQPGTIGFLSSERGEPVSMADLKQTLSTASRQLEAVFRDESDSSVIGIQFRSMAQNMQTAVDLLRLELVQSVRGDSVAAHQVGTVLDQLGRTRAVIRDQYRTFVAYLRMLKESDGLPM